MSELDPQPGELWETRDHYAVEKCEGGWCHPDGSWVERQDQVAGRLVGYTAEYVDNLRAEKDAYTGDVYRKYGEALQRAEYAESHITDGFDAVVEREPWRVLRLAADMSTISTCPPGTYKFLMGYADRLEREATEQSERDRLIGALESVTRESVEKVANAFMSVGIIDAEGVDAMVNLDFTEAIAAMAETMLADKAVDR